MKFTQKDLVEMQSHVLKFYLDTAVGGRLPGMDHNLTAENLVSLASFHAACIILNRKGLLKEGGLDLIDIERQDGELDTEGFDSAASNS